MLVYDPAKRPRAIQALAHPFFNELKQPRLELPNQQGTLPLDIFHFTQEEYDSMPALIETSLLPEWLPEGFMADVDRTHLHLNPRNKPRAGRRGARGVSLQKTSSHL